MAGYRAGDVRVMMRQHRGGFVKNRKRKKKIQYLKQRQEQDWYAKISKHRLPVVCRFCRKKGKEGYEKKRGLKGELFWAQQRVEVQQQ